MANDVERPVVDRHGNIDLSQHDARQCGGGEHARDPQAQDVQEPAQAAPAQQSNIVEDDGAHDSKHNPYDYSKLDEDIAARARASAEKIKGWHRDAIISSGNELRERKKEIPQREFMKWCARAVKLSPACVRNYMAAAREFSGVPLIVSVLPQTIVYRLAGASEEVRGGVIARVTAGEVVDPNEVRDLIKKDKAEAERLKAPKKAAKKEKATKRRLQREANELRKLHQKWEERDREEAIKVDGAIAIVRRWNVSADEFVQVLSVLGRLDLEKVRKHLEPVQDVTIGPADGP